MKVKSIKNVEPRTVYAITTSTKTFIADGLAHHNCVGCNMFQNGRPDVFAINLMNEGVDIRELQSRRNKIFKVNALWYEEKIKHYKDLIKQYEKN